MAVMLPISHWRCAKHTLNFVRQEVAHEACAWIMACVAATDVMHASEQDRNVLLQRL
jgi:hypothetical protein